MKPHVELPPALTVVTRDYRAARGAAERNGDGAPCPLRVVQWNVERCYKLRGIIDELLALDADVLALQEVDIGCERSSWVDGVEELGKALGLNCAFVAEFEELHSPLRSPATQGGGVHGQAVLTKFDFSEVRALVHSSQPVDWAAEGPARREPRRGKRVALAATVVAPPPVGHIMVYSLHLEVFCGIGARLHQFADVLQDSTAPGRPARQIICGDLNTMAHSVARLSPNYCCDSFRWRTLGRTEARFWAHNVFAVRYLHSLLVCMHAQPCHDDGPNDTGDKHARGVRRGRRGSRRGLSWTRLCAQSAARAPSWCKQCAPRCMAAATGALRNLHQQWVRRPVVSRRRLDAGPPHILGIHARQA